MGINYINIKYCDARTTYVCLRIPWADGYINKDDIDARTSVEKFNWVVGGG